MTNVLCLDDPTGTHAWTSTGLDTIDVARLSPRPALHVGDVLCTTRKCVWCHKEEAKPYGDGGNKPWRTVKQPTQEDT